MEIIKRIDEFLGFGRKKNKIEWYAESISELEKAFSKGYLSYGPQVTKELDKALKKVNPTGKLSIYDAVMKLSVDEADKLWSKLERLHSKSTDDWE